jgi:hypothetical protein
MARDLDPATRSALGSARLEGGELDADAVELVDRVARGELSGDDAVATMLARRGVVTPAR